MEAIAELPIMAKKKMGRPASSGVVKEHILGIRGTPEYKQWVMELADHCRLSLADTTDQGLVELARARGFAKNAPKR